MSESKTCPECAEDVGADDTKCRQCGATLGAPIPVPSGKGCDPMPYLILIVVVGLIAIPAIIVPQWILGIFLHDPETLELARLPMRLIAIFIATDTLGLVLMNALIGAGATRR